MKDKWTKEELEDFERWLAEFGKPIEDPERDRHN